MDETKGNNCGIEILKTPLLNEEVCDNLGTERDVSLVVESLISKVQEDSRDLENEIPEMHSLKFQEHHFEAPVDLGIAKKKRSISRAEADISKLESEVSVGVATSILKCRGDSSDLEKEIDFSFAKKKKKKKPAFIPETVVLAEEECSVATSLLDDLPMSDSLISDISNDYPYEYLLSRFMDLMREKNSNVDIAVRKKLIMKPPQVLRAGTKRTSFANFLELCKIMRRTPQHVQSYLIVELGTNGSIDSNGQLVIKGKFQQKQLENVLRRYIKEYVTCHTCHSPDTVLLKQTRLCFLQCEACGSRCSVPVIKSGFQAVINKRATMRAKYN